jgi:hypothetical protein
VNKKHNNLTAQHLKLLDDIFVEQDWDKENLFNRFCVSLQFLSETQQKLIIELTKNFGSLGIQGVHPYVGMK